MTDVSFTPLPVASLLALVLFESMVIVLTFMYELETLRRAGAVASCCGCDCEAGTCSIDFLALVGILDGDVAVLAALALTAEAVEREAAEALVT